MSANDAFGGRQGHAFAPGDRLGRYELVRQLGGGGFAAVWLAQAPGPGGFVRMAAVKVIRPGRAQDKRFQDMLLDEARLVARIHHPAVAQIWEVGEDPRSLYFVMELVDGDSLDELRYRAEEAAQTLPPRAVFRVLADVCGGLHAAHELAQDGVLVGLVHRDVSPQNILVSRLGNAKLIDFGIALAKERLAKDTTTGLIKGKVVYMSPEQARAERDVDRRADVWAIGAVAYELIEGRPPFDAHTDIGRLAALVGPSPIAPMTERMPAALQPVVARALEKDRDRRYATALDLKEAIEEALIHAELETSEHDVARLLAPWFPSARSDPPRADASAAGRTPGVATTHPVPAHASPDFAERPVSSTIEVRPAATDRIEIPENRPRGPLAVIAAALAAASGLWWATTRPPPTAANTGIAGAVPAMVAPRLPPAAERVPLSPAPATASASAPRVQAPRRSPKAPHAVKTPPRPTPQAVDENAIE